MNGYGRKGCVGPTAGKLATRYEATAPDGSVIKTRSFFTHASHGIMAVLLCPEGKWHANGVRRLDETWHDHPAPSPTYAFVPCVAVPRNGFRFLHRHWLTEDRQGHAEYVVTAVRRGAVHYRPAAGGAGLYCPVGAFWDSVLEPVP